jgi:mannose-1-phosphate guanylyltransferase
VIFVVENMSKSVYAVILAGGRGERFWPLSTPENPKPFLRFFSVRSLLQQTFDRARRLVPDDRIFLVVGEQHEALAKEQLPALESSHLLLEPSGRDTAAAIGYASLHIPENALMLVLPADHLIPDTDAFVNTMRTGLEYVLKHDVLATFGIRPTRPETNYGYVKAAPENLGSHEFPLFAVERFVEKPDRERAQQFFREPFYFWNSGMFLWRVSDIQKLMARLLPELWKGLLKAHNEQDDRDAFRETYSGLERISIDYGVMEKAENVIIVPASFAWDDVGTWNSLMRILPLNEDGNLIWGEHAGLETSNCTIYSDDQMIVTAGIQDLIIVQKAGKILICTREYADRLKELLAKL